MRVLIPNAVVAALLVGASDARASANTIEITAIQEGSSLVVTWPPVPQSMWPASSAGGPYTEQIYFVFARDMDPNAAPLHYYCDGTAKHPNATGYVRVTQNRCVFTNLPLGRTYNVTVLSSVSNAGGHTNSAGTGDLYAKGGVRMCCVAPAPPRDLRVEDLGRGEALAVWTSPVDSGGAPQVTYTVSLSPGSARCETTQTECRFTGLRYDTPYTAQVTAVNPAGLSPTVNSSAINLTPPSPRAPARVRAVLADGDATVRWQPPRTSDGQVVARYTATASPGGRTCTTQKTSCTVKDLEPGGTFTFTVTAIDSLGRKARSKSSRPLTTPTPVVQLPPPPKPEVPVG